MASVFSLYVAILSSSVSRAPACSPAATRLTNRSSKCNGCLPSASASDVPPSTSDLIARMSFCIAGFSCPAPTMSNDCTSGMPAVIIVASCREKMAISPGVTLPCLRNSMLCLRTRVGTTPWRRSSERTAASLVETTLPLTLLPVRSVPSHVKGAWVAVAVAIDSLSSGYSGLSFGRYSLVNCNSVDLFQTGKAVLDFLEARLPQVGHAFGLGLRGNLHRVAAFHHDAAQRLRARHDLVDANPAFVAGGALAAAFGTEDSHPGLDVGFGEALFEKGLARDID